MKNKKGQLDKIISGFPVMISIVLIIGVFIFLSFIIKEFKIPEKPQIIINNQDFANNSVLLQTIDVEGKKMLVIDGLIKYRWQSKAPFDKQGFDYKLVAALKDFISKSNAETDYKYNSVCLYLGIEDIEGKGADLAFIRYHDGGLFESDNKKYSGSKRGTYILDYDEKNFKIEYILKEKSIFINGEPYFVFYSYRKCKGGKQ